MVSPGIPPTESYITSIAASCSRGLHILHAQFSYLDILAAIQVSLHFVQSLHLQLPVVELFHISILL